MTKSKKKVTAKRKPKKKAGRASPDGKIRPRQKRITDEIGQQMYLRWAEELRATTGWTGLSVEFGFTRHSIRKYSVRHDWEIQYKRYIEKTQKKGESDLAKRYKVKMQKAGELADAAHQSLYVDPTATKRVLKNDATIGESVQASKYEDELADKFPDRADESASTMTEEEVTLITAAIEMLGVDGLKGMGKLIVEKADQLAKEQEPEE